MKQWRKIIILGGVLILLIGLLVATPHIRGTDEEESTSPLPDYEPIISLESDEISSITVKNESGQLVITRETHISDEEEQEEWVLTSHPDLRYSKSTLRSKISYLRNIPVRDEITMDISDLDDYGLENPHAVVTLNLVSGEEIRVLYGDKTVTGNLRYAMLEGDERVCTISSLYFSAAELTVLEIYDRNILGDINSENIKKIEFSRRNDDYDFVAEVQRDDEEDPDDAMMVSLWHFIEPVQADASLDGFHQFKEEILNLSPMKFVEIGPEDFSEYRLDNPDYEFVLKSKDSTVNIKIGGDGGGTGHYAYTDYADAVFVIPRLNFVDKPSRELLSPFVHMASIWEVDSIDIQIGSERIFCEIKDDQDKDEPSDFKVNGQDANVVNSRGNSYFRTFYQAVISVYIGGLDPDAQPAHDPFAKIEYSMKEGFEDMLLEFVKRDDTTYYVFKQGEYQGYYMNRSDFYSETPGRKGILPAYEVLKNAMDNQVDGVYDE